ncbi:HlyD family efflux transporter periplasmic adaptor subunit [Bilifractor porci]|uniref:RND related barrel-sandwich hybrid domain-containing protein n=1 Tax=Bilifractor porci TaxID=2606636 RepID=A0A7X2P5X5_9FIRM|nr:HlyD family efflux transporter periplasmic adaptor subunit [Bilifractor porci]MST80794.1 hypothetical protein [Bilifractor porci]
MKERRGFNLNIGTVIFGALAVYLVITLFLYLASDRITPYLVTSGTLSRNQTYTALALRTEHVVNSTADGYVRYYDAELTKAKKGAAVCSITDTQESTTSGTVTEQNTDALRELASKYSRSYTGSDFHSVYDFKYSLNSAASQDDSQASTKSGSPVYADGDGIVCYTSDGMEGLTVDQITADSFDSKSYKKTSLRTEDTVKAGDGVYRLVTDENWSLVFPVTDSQYDTLAQLDTVKVRFAKDENTENGDVNLFETDGQKYCQVLLYRGMIRYANDRYLDIELVTNTQSGLKLPLTSIVHKDFYLIPAAFLTSGGENGEQGFLVETTDEKGNKSTTFVETELYELADAAIDTDSSSASASGGESVSSDSVSSSSGGTVSCYYVDKADFNKGDVIIQPDTNATYTIGETASLEGVYCVNKGYADFRKVQIIDQNDEYCLVAAGTDYGISQYDYIIKDAENIKENTVIIGQTA